MSSEEDQRDHLLPSDPSESDDGLKLKPLNESALPNFEQLDDAPEAEVEVETPIQEAEIADYDPLDEAQGSGGKGSFNFKGNKILPIIILLIIIIAIFAALGAIGGGSSQETAPNATPLPPSATPVHKNKQQQHKKHQGQSKKKHKPLPGVVLIPNKKHHKKNNSNSQPPSNSTNPDSGSDPSNPFSIIGTDPLLNKAVTLIEGHRYSSYYRDHPQAFVDMLSQKLNYPVVSRLALRHNTLGVLVVAPTGDVILGHVGKGARIPKIAHLKNVFPAEVVVIKPPQAPKLSGAGSR